MNTSPANRVHRDNPCSAAAAGGGAGAGRLAGGGGGGGATTRCVSTGTTAAGGGGGGGRAALFLPSVRYPPTRPRRPRSRPRECRRPSASSCPRESSCSHAGSASVGAVVTSVGASADAVRCRGGGRRWLLLAPGFGAATGCSGQTRWRILPSWSKALAGSLESAREMARVRNSGASARLARALGISSKIVLIEDWCGPNRRYTAAHR